MTDILKDIESKFGKGSIFKLGDRAVETVPAFSTGILGLDAALGIWGIPKGRITEVIGQTGTGKCLTKDSYIFTANGYKTVEEIFQSCGFEAFCVNKTLPYRYSLVNRFGEIESTKAFTWNGRRKVLEIKTDSGNVIRTTVNHPHLTISKQGNFIWKQALDYEIGDYLCLSRFNKFGTRDISTEVEAYLLGVLIADGHLGEGKIHVTNDDACIKNLIEEKLSDSFGFKPYKKYDNNGKGSFDYHFYDKKNVNLFYSKYGLKPCLSKDKYISQFIRELSKPYLIKFIQGFAECEGYFTNRSLEITSASYNLLYQLKLILSQFGVIAALNKKTVKSYQQNSYYRLNISGSNFDRYISEIGIFSKFKLEQAGNLFSNSKNNVGEYDIIPFIDGLVRDAYAVLPERSRKTCQEFITCHGHNYNRLNKLIDLLPDNEPVKSTLQNIVNLNYFFDKVISVELLDEALPTFDFSMDNSNSFIANNIITHNTSVCLAIAADAQSKGEKVAFVDMEHALSSAHAEQFGVNLDDLFVSQPMSGNEALSITKLLIESGEFGLVVVDSIAALLPEQETNQEDFGASNVGLHARLMAQACRKLNPLASKHNVALVFCNQYRTNIAAAAYGDPNVPTGGNSMKYAASVRIELKRLTQIKEGEDIVGHNMRAKTLKNKCFRPFMECDYPIYYGSSNSKIDEVIDLAIEYGLIKKGGAWFTFGENKFQGSIKLRAFLIENKDLYNDLRDRVKECLQKYVVEGQKKDKKKIEGDSE